MKIKAGIDIVYLPKFHKTLKNAGAHFLKRVYLSAELKDQRITRLAGIFAAKEAVIKALGLPLDSWHSIKVTNASSGAPKIELLHSKLDIKHHSISIAHDGNYVIAQFMVLI